MEGITVLSLFDGMSCGQIALQKLGIKIKQYYASEIDKYTIKVTQDNSPNTIQIGDVTKVKAKDLPKIDLLIGGSPCQGFSFAGKQLAFNDPQSKLFFEFVRLKNECDPRYFLLENVIMKKEYEYIISKYMGIDPIEINSALVSGQRRVRNYWTNIASGPYGLFGDTQCMIPQPKDKGILLRDILENEVDEKYYIKSETHLKFIIDPQQINKQWTQVNGRKALTQTARQYASWWGDYICNTKSKHLFKKDHLIMQLNPSTESDDKQPCQQNRIYDVDGISPALMAQMSGGSHAILEQGMRIRRLTPTECERLQTVPDGYTSMVSDAQRYKMLGNGWTVDVIAHIFSYMEL